MVRAFIALSLALMVLVALSSSPGQRADAAEVDADCNALLALTSNEGQQPFLWPIFGFMNYTQEGPLDEPRQFHFTTQAAAPVNIVGTAYEDGYLSGLGLGTYSGVQTFFGFQGYITFWDDFQFFPRTIVGNYSFDPTDSGDSVISTYCTFDPPDSIADPDDDGIPSTVIVPYTLNFNGSGSLSPDQTELLVRGGVGDPQQITLTDTSKFNLTFEKTGFADAIIERSYNRAHVEFMGIFSQGSTVDVGLPPELDDAIIPTDISGGFVTNVKGDPPITVILNQSGYSMGTGAPIPLLGGAQSSGPWTWQSNGGTVDSFDFLNGQFSGSGETEIYAEGLAALPPVSFRGPGVQWDELGDPLRFQEDFEGQITTGVNWVVDNCPDVPNVDQADADLDGNGDACDGFYWFDANCSGRWNMRDIIYTLNAVAGVSFTEPPNCPPLGDPWGDRIGGDWDCSLNLDILDVLYGLRYFGDISAAVPEDCPDPGGFVPE